MEFRSIHILQTDENIPLKVEFGGIANRVFAFMIDWILMGLVMGVALIVYLLFMSRHAEVGRTYLPIALFLIFFGFHLIQEWLWNGKTVGKHLFNIRVVRTNGQAIGFWEAFGRNLFRIIDVYLSGVGLICMMFSKEERRLGDYVAGTLVISDHIIERPLLKATVEARFESDQPKVSNGDVMTTSLTPEEYEMIRNFLGRRERMFFKFRREMAEAMAGYFKQRLHYLRDIEKEQPDEVLLNMLYEDYQKTVLRNTD